MDEKIIERQPLIEPLQNINEYINMRFPLIIIIALAIIAILLLYKPQIFGDIFGSRKTKLTTA